MKRAYRTTWQGIVSIVAAESVAQARSRTQASANEAGYSPQWVDIRVVRATEYDGWAAVDATGHCWAEDQMENCREPKLDTRGKVDDMNEVPTNVVAKIKEAITESDNRMLAEVESMLRGISQRCGQAATIEWAKTEIDRVANLLRTWQR